MDTQTSTQEAGNMTTMTSDGRRRIPLTRFGFVAPIGAQIVTDDGRLYDVVGVYRREFPYPVTMLRTRHFDGSEGPDLFAGSVWLLDREWKPQGA